MRFAHRPPLARLDISLLVVFGLAGPLLTTAVAQQTVRFNRDIRPIFSDRCYLCHGPDSSSREAGFRLDQRDSATGEADSGGRPIVPGDPDASQLMQRITATDQYEVMPPPDSHKSRLTAEEIERIRRWIAAGAEYEPHWSLIPPRRPELPPVADRPHPVDRWIGARLDEAGMPFSGEADKRTLLRRVSLDLTGLPPTVGEIEAFLQDDSPDAWERVVDRLLDSPRHGEHMARYWLDAVRYGDTHGLHLDNYREIWPYRDWVIDAFNRNMSWDEFTTRQLAGDLLENPQTDDLVASGYNRLHITTNEGGAIREEVRVRNVIDRVETFGTVYLGMTVGCAVCHDHKFDPISARDFYSLYAFFNNLDADPMDGNAKDHAPVIQVPTAEQRAQLQDLDRRIEERVAEMNRPDPQMEAARRQWESVWRAEMQSMWQDLKPQTAHGEGGVELTIEDDGTIQAAGGNPDKTVYEITARSEGGRWAALRLLAEVDPRAPQASNGRGSNGNAVLSEIELAIRPAGSAGEFQPVRLVNAVADHSQANFPVQQAVDGKIDDATGWATEGYARKEPRTAVFVPGQPFGFDTGTELRVRLHFVSRYSAHALARVRLALTGNGTLWPVTSGEWSQIGPFPGDDGQQAWHHDFGPESDPDPGRSYGEGLTWQPAAGFQDGQVRGLVGGIGAWYFSREIFSPDQRELPVALGSDDGIRVWLNDNLVHENNVARGVKPDQDPVTLPLQPGRNRLLIKIINFGGAAGIYYNPVPDARPVPDLALATIVRLPEAGRSEEQANRLRDFFLANHSPRWAGLKTKLEELQAQRQQLDASLPTTLVMKELAEPRPSYLLKRGQYDQPDTERGALPAVVPPVFRPLGSDMPANRLGLARWLLAADHPLMARVTVNRFWQQLFGRGLVATAGDFGSQGSWPSHPELLDWLAVEFRESGWDVRHLMKLMVMSQTYRQSSRMTPDMWAADPENILLARGPRFRMDAEVLRDQALSVSGLLVNRIGGPGVRPPQPEGIWKAVAYVGSNTDTFTADSGPDNVHRRSIYTFWKRTAPPPQMSTFDAPNRESCTVRRERTNTPLQALLMLNDPQYVEAGRYLAARVLSGPDDQPEPRAARMFEMATGRPATPAETGELVSLFTDRLQWYRRHPEAARKLIAIGDVPDNSNLDIARLAAWTLVANAVLNLDEVITRE